jgi:hypothetical protein
VAPLVLCRGCMHKVAISVALLTASVTAAHADTEAVTPVATAAPQNEDWSNVSHINGVPVKIGERSDYLFRQKKTNIAGNPFGVFFGLYDLSVARALGQNVAVSAAITATDDGMQLSATAPLYFRRVFSGPFLEGGLLYRDLGSGDSWAGPQLLLGWHWTFDSGLNLAIAGGLAKQMTDDGDVDVNGYLRVGYAF